MKRSKLTAIVSALWLITWCAVAVPVEPGTPGAPENPLRAPPLFTEVTYWIVMVLNGIGVSIIVGGTIFISMRVLRAVLGGRESSGVYPRYRAGIGRSILLGLEFLLAASVISTVAIAPTFRNVGILALIILTRGALSYMLDKELDRQR